VDDHAVEHYNDMIRQGAALNFPVVVIYYFYHGVAKRGIVLRRLELLWETGLGVEIEAQGRATWFSERQYLVFGTACTRGYRYPWDCFVVDQLVGQPQRGKEVDMPVPG